MNHALNANGYLTLPRALALAATLLLTLTPAARQAAAAGRHAPGASDSRGHQQEAAGHSHAKAALHGGEVAMTQEFHVETVFARDGLRLYLYDASQHPSSMRGVTGEVTVETRAGKPKAVQLRYVEPSAPGEQDSLQCDHDFSSTRPGEARVTIALDGLPGTAEKQLRLKVKFGGLSPEAPAAGHQGRHGSGGESGARGLPGAPTGSDTEEHSSHGHGNH